MASPLRLADIAAQAHVSEATVSRVLNDKPHVSASTRQAVLTAIDVLGYERPVALRRHATGLVGVVVPELTNPVFPAFAQVIEATLSRSNYTAMLCAQAAGGVTEDEYIELLRDRGAAGIIFIGGLHADARASLERYEHLLGSGIALVLVNGHRPELSVPSLGTDDAGAVDAAVRHLAQLGHRRIGLAVGPQRYLVVQRKVNAFEPAVRRHAGPDAEASVKHALFSVEGGALAAQRLLERGVTAIVAASDLMALGAIQAVRDAGLRVPDDVSVVGFDDSALMPFVDPPLTTLRQDIPALGEAAVAALLDQVGRIHPEHEETLFPAQLVLRRSTAVAPPAHTPRRTRA